MTNAQVKLIGIMKQRKVSRKELREILKTTDDKARELLREIRHKYPVINFQDNDGYFISYKVEDIDRMIAQEKARANKIYQNVKVLEYYKEKGEV